MWPEAARVAAHHLSGFRADIGRDLTLKLKQRTSSSIGLIVLVAAIWTLFSAVQLAPGAAAAAGLDLGGTASTATSAVSNATSTATTTAGTATAAEPAPPAPTAPPVAKVVAQVQTPAAPSPPASTPAPPKAEAPSTELPAEVSVPKPPAPVNHLSSTATKTIDKVAADLKSDAGRATNPGDLLPSASLPKGPSAGLPSELGDAIGSPGAAIPALPVVGSLTSPKQIDGALDGVGSILPVVGGLTGGAATIPESVGKTLAPLMGALPTILGPVVKNDVPQVLAPVKGALSTLPEIGTLLPPLGALTNPITHLSLPVPHLPLFHPSPPAPASSSPGSPAGGGVPAPAAGAPTTPPASPSYDVWLKRASGPGGSVPTGLGRGGLGGPDGFMATPGSTFGPAGSGVLSAPSAPPIEPGNGPQNSPQAPLPAPSGTTSLTGGFGGSFFVPIAALMALVGLSAPAILRRLREAAALPAPTPFICALERPG